MTKVNPENMKELYETLWDIFCKKNHDYGNSFERSLDMHGLVAGIVRMEDKMNRLSTLTQGDKDAQIASESLVDTLMDLSNYSAMAACWLMHKDDEFDDHISKGFSGSIVVTGTEDLETVKNLFHLSSFEGHQEKVNERAYYDRDDVTDEEIIKNWGLVGDNDTVRSRTTGYYLVEDDNPELFRKIYGVLLKHTNLSATWKPASEDITKASSLSMIVEDFNHPLNEPKQFSTKLKGLENGYVIRQHKKSDNSYRYTLAFNPEGTIKIGDDVAKPYVIECFSNDHDGTDIWAIHVFDTREDMVAALNYDLRVRRKNWSKNLGDSIKELDVKVSVFTHLDVPKVLDIWDDTFGEAFNNQMLSKDLRTEESIELYQGIKTFGPVFISEKTGALIIKGTIREDSVKRPCDFIWFGDTKEVLLDVNHALPKFNRNGIIHGVTYNDDNYVSYFNPLYDTMVGKIMYKFKSWSGSELKNLVFFNEDDDVKSGKLDLENGKLKIDFEDSEAYFGEKS